MKRIVTLYLDSAVVRELRSRGYNLSKLVNDYLQSVLSAETRGEAPDAAALETEIQSCQEKLHQLQARIAELAERKAAMERKKLEEAEARQRNEKMGQKEAVRRAKMRAAFLEVKREQEGLSADEARELEGLRKILEEDRGG